MKAMTLEDVSVEVTAAFPPFKWIVHLKMKSVSSFFNPNVVPNLYGLKNKNFGPCCVHKNHILQNVKKKKMQVLNNMR